MYAVRVVLTHEKVRPHCAFDKRDNAVVVRLKSSYYGLGFFYLLNNLIRNIVMYKLYLTGGCVWQVFIHGARVI